MTSDVRNFLAAVAALVLGLIALRVLGQMAAGHAVQWVRQNGPGRRPRHR